MNYDGIPKQKWAARLTEICGISRSTAHRMLSEEGKEKAYARRLFDLADGLDVDWQWLYEGLPGYDSYFAAVFIPRVMRIHIQEIKGYPKEDTDKIMRLFTGYVAGHSKAKNLFNLAGTGQISYPSAARLL
jgi:hypothetical protein